MLCVPPLRSAPQPLRVPPPQTRARFRVFATEAWDVARYDPARRPLHSVDKLWVVAGADLAYVYAAGARTVAACKHNP